MRSWLLFIAMGLAGASGQAEGVRVDSREVANGVKIAVMDRQTEEGGDAFAIQLRLGPMLEQEGESGASRTLAARIGAALEQTGLARACLTSMHLDRLEWVCGVEVESAEDFGDLADAARCVVELDDVCWGIDIDGRAIGTPDKGRLARLDAVSSQLESTGALRAGVEELRSGSMASDDLARDFLRRVGYHDRLVMCAIVAQGDAGAIARAIDSVFAPSPDEDAMDSIDLELFDAFADTSSPSEERCVPVGLAVLEREGLPVDAVELIFPVDNDGDDRTWVISNMAAGLALERLARSEVRTIVDPVAQVADVPGFGTLATITMIVPSGHGKAAIDKAQTVIKRLSDHAVTEEELDAARAHALSPLVEHIERNPRLDSRQLAVQLARELGSGRLVNAPVEVFHSMNIRALSVNAELLGGEADAILNANPGATVLMTASRPEAEPSETLVTRQQPRSQQRSDEQAERTERLKMAFRMETRFEIRQADVPERAESRRLADSSVSAADPSVVRESIELEEEPTEIEVIAVRITAGAIEAETSIGVTIGVSTLLPLAEGLVHVGLVVGADAVEQARVVERDEVARALRALVDDAGDAFREGAHVELRSASVDLDLVELAVEALSGD